MVKRCRRSAVDGRRLRRLARSAETAIADAPSTTFTPPSAPRGDVNQSIPSSRVEEISLLVANGSYFDLGLIAGLVAALGDCKGFVGRWR